MSKIGRNMLWLLLSQASTWIVSIVMLVVEPHLLADAEFGRSEFAFTFVGFFTLFAILGTGTYITKSTARDETAVGPYVYNALVLKLIGVPLVAIGAISTAVSLRYDGQAVALVAICSVGMLPVVLNDTVVAGLHGRQRMKRPALWTAVQQYVSAALSLCVLATTGSVPLFVLALVSTYFISFTANLVQVWPDLRGHMRVDLRLWRQLLRGGVPFLAWSAVLLVLAKIDIPLLQALGNPAEVGWYGLAINWVSLPAFFAAVVSTAYFPELSAQGASLSPAYVRLGNQALRTVSFVSIPAAVGIALVADDLFGFLRYPIEYRNAVPLIQILSTGLPVVAIDVVLGALLIAVDRQRRWLYVGCIAVVINPVLNLAAIPLTQHYFANGAVGASVVTVATEIVMLIGALRLRPAGILDDTTSLFMVRCVLASGAMVPALVVVRHAPLGVRIGIGIAVYVAASMALRTFRRNQWRADFLPRHDAADGAAANDPAAVVALR